MLRSWREPRRPDVTRLSSPEAPGASPENGLFQAHACSYTGFTMSGYGQFCPVAVACEVFAQRWTPLILREIFAGSRHFNEIHRGLPQISRTLLATRLRQLEDAGVVMAGPAASGGAHEYRLTEAGEEFRPVVEGLGAWGQRWTVRVDTNNLDAGFLMWNLQRRIAVDELPAQHLLVEFRFRGLP